MTLSSLSSTQRIAAQQDFETDRVRALVAKYLGIDVGRVTDEAHFSDDLGADWLDRLELMILMEDEFTGVQITEDDADQIQVVGDLIRHIEITNHEQRGGSGRRNAGPVFRRFVRPQSTGTVWNPPGEKCAGK